MIKTKKDYVIVSLGLAGAGKTTFYKCINSKGKDAGTPGAKYNQGVFQFSSKRISFFDCEGSSDAQSKSWDNVLPMAEGLIWMVDMTDKDNLDQSVQALKEVVFKLKKRIPILVLGNKSDLPNAMTPIQLNQAFDSIATHIDTISAATGKNTNEAFKLIVSKVKEARKQEKSAEEAEKSLHKLRQNQMTAQSYRNKHDKDD